MHTRIHLPGRNILQRLSGKTYPYLIPCSWGTHII